MQSRGWQLANIVAKVAIDTFLLNHDLLDLLLHNFNAESGPGFILVLTLMLGEELSLQVPHSSEVVLHVVWHSHS